MQQGLPTYRCDGADGSISGVCPGLQILDVPNCIFLLLRAEFVNAQLSGLKFQTGTMLEVSTRLRIKLDIGYLWRKIKSPIINDLYWSAL